MNQLAQETSPYLLQHANNPVHWQAWNDISLAKAKEKLTELQMKKMEYLRAANKAYLLVHELTGKLNIESALERLSKRQ